MWSVAFTDVIQFVLMLGFVNSFTISDECSWWWPGLTEKLPEGAMTLIKNSGTYDWKLLLQFFFRNRMGLC